MNIELSITVWPIVSLALWFLVWAFVTVCGCGATVLLWDAVRERTWGASVARGFVTLLIWGYQWGLGLWLNEWLKIVLGE